MLNLIHWSLEKCESTPLWDAITPTGMAVIKKEDSKCVTGVGRLEFSCIAGGAVKWCNPFGKQFGSPSKLYMLSYCMTQQLHL